MSNNAAPQSNQPSQEPARQDGPTLLERLRIPRVQDSITETYAEAADRIEELEGGYRDIMKATIDGRVCDDVAWFDNITTLHDFCDLVLNGPDPISGVARGQNND